MTEDDHKILFETEHWKVILMDEQSYLGRSVVVLKGSRGDLADLSEEELIDFLGVVRRYESLLRRVFGATMFNWACLMNNAYQDPDPKPHVHWHVRPRYKDPVHLAGEVFEDPNFGHHYLRGSEGDKIVSSELLQKISETLRFAQ